MPVTVTPSKAPGTSTGDLEEYQDIDGEALQVDGSSVIPSLFLRSVCTSV